MAHARFLATDGPPTLKGGYPIDIRRQSDDLSGTGMARAIAPPP
jgi:hypothetical protein